MKVGRWIKVGALVAVIAIAKQYGGALGLDKDAALHYFQQWSERLGVWAILFTLVFRSSTSAKNWVHSNKYFHILSCGVERDGWRFVILARFSPIPSYVINYALAATNVRFVLDFLLPTVIGGIPMILQNTSIGSLAGAAVASASGSQKSKVRSYVFPLLGIMSSVLISLRIKKYSSDIKLAESSSRDDTKSE
ncbi:SNARE associated Golgi protein family isoform 2 [Hibiscus syriacus]|uniref:SNARE associated Golgi protein family isoform 2 n=1 Tax=Hibiscus syriacus TaxID=106335 RepID=A0A6A2Y2C1_HIBSY|nr:SNARE associated Golgi protein family isoform 2 [Hibiscus syriacus]